MYVEARPDATANAARSMRTAVIVNPASGTQQNSVDAVKQLLASLSLEADVISPEPGQDISALGARLSTSYDMLVAGGGDGTVNALAASMIAAAPERHHVVIGILPLGTLNHLAKDLALPPDPAAAARVLQEGRPIPIDVGEVNGHYFLNMSSVGLYPRIVDLRERWRKRFGWPKWIAHAVGSVVVLWEFVLYPVRIEINGTTIKRWSPNVTITNNPYKVEGRNLGARQSLSRGCLNLVVALAHSRRGVLKLAWMAVTGRLRRSRDVEIHTCTELVVHMHAHHARVSLDGEVRQMIPPLHYRVHPAALRIMAPANVEEVMSRR